VADTLRKQTEMDLFKQWRTHESVPAFQQLYVSMKPLLHDAAKKASYGSNVPESAHRIWAAQVFHDALRTYNPTAGTALQSHVYNAVHQKAKRLNYLYQNIGHIPEDRMSKIGLYYNVYENLKSHLGREPTTAELADELQWGVKTVEKIQTEIRKDLAMDVGTEEVAVFESSADEEILEYIYYELTSEEQLVYDYVFGKHGKPRKIKANNKIDFEGIGKAAGFSASKARALWTKIRMKLQKALHR
jgi:DNA-directed RNA polymerase specialized sigma subunit